METAGKGEENRGRRKQPERETEERSNEESTESDAKTLEEAGVIRQDKCTAAKKRRRRCGRGRVKSDRRKSGRAEESRGESRKAPCVLLARKERDRERNPEREREEEEGWKEREEKRAKGGRKESWQLLGACGVGPFKARSPDARRRNCPPRVTPTPRYAVVRLAPHHSRSPSSLSVAVHILRVLYFFFVSLVCLPPSCPPDTSKETRTARRDGLYEISSTSCVPLISLSLSFSSFFPVYSSAPSPVLLHSSSPYLRCLVLFVSPDPSSCLLLQCVTKNARLAAIFNWQSNGLTSSGTTTRARVCTFNLYDNAHSLVIKCEIRYVAAEFPRDIVTFITRDAQ